VYPWKERELETFHEKQVLWGKTNEGRAYSEVNYDEVGRGGTQRKPFKSKKSWEKREARVEK